jgi:rubredoxin-NAD+ reductase
MQAPIIIIGSGLAAYTTLREIRKLHPEINITLITSEGGDFYSKPMLSTAFANQKNAAQLVTTPKEKMMEQLKFHLLAKTHVVAIHPTDHTLEVDMQGQKTSLPYSKLVLALGADPIRLALDGDGANEVLSVNNLEDYSVLREKLPAGKRVAILGAGLIGCEFANDLIIGGYAVDVIDPASTPLNRLLPPEIAKRLHQKLAEIGVDWHLDTTATTIAKNPAGLYELYLKNGESITVDVVLSAVGLRPRTQLAAQAGLTVNRGIVVNRQMQASHPDIFALGDCVEVEQLILPYVMPIMQSAKVLAANVLGDAKEITYPAMPVMVKTPALPLIIAPPSQGSVGHWHIEEDSTGAVATFTNGNQELLGYVLAGTGTSQRSVLTSQLPAMIS